MSILTLNDDIFKEVLTYLDLKSLISFSGVNTRINRLVNDGHGKHWKTLCSKHWLKYEKTDSSIPWKTYYQKFYFEFGEFTDIYAKFHPSWVKFEDFLNVNCPKISATLNHGLTKGEFNTIQAKYYDDKEKFPKCLKLMYRLFNGQKVQTEHRSLLSLFGSHHQFLPSLLFIDFQNACNLKTNALLRFYSKNKMDDSISIYPICCSNMYLSGTVICLILHHKEDCTVKEYITMCYWPLPMQPIHRFPFGGSTKQNYNFDDHYIIAYSFEDWLLQHMENVIEGSYPIEEGGITNCPNDPSCVAKTGNITVRVGHTFCLDTAGSRYFPYRITMSMDEHADPKETCRLETRHWEITDFSTGSTSHVNGRGVVGDYPTMTPGASYSWISCTFFADSGSMKGHFVMRVLETKDTIEVKCPEYIMNVPETLSSVLK